jgi:eukaryotic-like serine/threonine-protein kinase
MASQRELVGQLFEAALALKPADRDAFLDKECSSDPELRRVVEGLLDADARAGSFLEHAVLPRPTPDSLDTTGTVIGPYHLLERIGEGGMGEVWLAEQKQPVRRRVAIKLIKEGMNTREVVARFESERQALALMDHPAIAKVFDAGSTPEGRPYFAMEYVAGIPITVYCDKHKLTMRQRMELFILVCEGVQHAHQKAIIHRDLKPSNILVIEVDGKPVPRIIDFGVAKATSQKLTAGTMYTRVGAILGTLEYMSPEQADSAGEDIDTRTDVYSLGAVLYELLVGALPLDFKKLAYDEVLRLLREQDVPRPSTRLLTLGDHSAITAQNRGTDPPTLARQLRGDADAIILKTLEKDRARRYATPSELAADLGRYLRNEPVTAHPPSAEYRIHKYIRRHRLGVAVAGAGLLLLIAFAFVQAVELRRITHERDRATRERDRADRITQFMTDMFKMSNPSEARGNTVTAREILDKGAKEIGTGLGNDSELQAKMMYTMAETYEGLGLESRAQPLLERALEIQRRVLGPEHPDTLRSMSTLADVLANEGHYAEAEKLQRETLEIRRRVLGPEDPETLTSMSLLAATLLYDGHHAEAEKLQRETLEIRRRVLGPEHPDTLVSMGLLAYTLSREHHYSEAEKLYGETLDIQRRVLGPTHPGTLLSMSNLADTSGEEGNFTAQEKLAREALEIQRRVLGPEHPDTLYSMTNLAYALAGEGRYTEAEKLARETLEIQRRVLGPEHPDTLGSMGSLAYALAGEGRYTEAEKLLRETLEIQRRVLSPEHPDTLDTMADLAYALAGEGRYTEAEKLQKEALEIQRRVLGPEHPDTLHSLGLDAIYIGMEGRYDDAEKLFREAIATAGKVSEPGVLGDAWYSFASGAAVTGHRDEALKYLGQAIDHGYAHPDEMKADRDLKSLHGDSRFEALLAKARQNATAK